MPKMKRIAKKLILTLRSIMISEEVDLVAVISMEQLGPGSQRFWKVSMVLSPSLGKLLA